MSYHRKITAGICLGVGGVLISLILVGPKQSELHDLLFIDSDDDGRA